jgi:hypothetical protein
MLRFIWTATAVFVLAVVFSIQPASADAVGYPTFTGANTAAANGEFCPGVAVTTLPAASVTVAAGKAKVLAGRKSIAIQNLSSATCYLTFDAQNPTSTGSLGWKWAASDAWSRDYGDRFTVKAVCTAATTTPNCLQIEQAK